MEADKWQVGDVVRYTVTDQERYQYNQECEVTSVVGTRGSQYVTINQDDCFNVGCMYTARFQFVRRPSSEQKPVPVYDPQTNTLELPKTALIDRFEKKHACAICTVQAFGRLMLGDEEPIRHDDPCQYTHDERYMLPGIRALFRANQARRVANTERYKKGKEELELLGRVEKAVKEMRDGGCAPYTPSLYRELTENDK